MIFEDGTSAALEGQHEEAWYTFLRLSNLLQFAPLTFMTTREVLSHGRFEDIEHLIPQSFTSEVSQTADTELSREQREALEESEEDYHDFLKSLFSQNIDAPQVGDELSNNEGVVIAVCEFHWPAEKLAIVEDLDEYDLPSIPEYLIIDLAEAIKQPSFLIERLIGDR